MCDTALSLQFTTNTITVIVCSCTTDLISSVVRSTQKSYLSISIESKSQIKLIFT